MANHITHDPIYDTVDRDDFMSMIEVERYADRVDVFVDRGGGDGLGRLEQPGVDHLEPRVAQDSGDHFDPAIVPVKADLGDEDSFSGHRQT